MMFKLYNKIPEVQCFQVELEPVCHLQTLLLFRQP